MTASGKSLLVLMAVLSCTACATTRSPEGDTGDPVVDARNAYGHGEYRLAAVNAVKLSIPGITADAELARKVAMKYGVINLSGGGPSSEAYGADYNRTMMGLLGCDVEHPMARCSKP